MAASRRWVTVTAASALGIGVIASGAIGVARAMPLVDSTTIAVVPPITTIGDASRATPAPGATSDPTTRPPEPAASDAPPTPSGNDVDQSTAPVPQPVAPRPAGTASPLSVSVPSPASVDDDSSGRDDD